MAVLLLAPLVLLWPSVFGGHTFVPYDLAAFPPVSTSLTQEQLEPTRVGANYDVTEIPIWFVPELELARQAVSEGRLPQWNGYARSGTALMAHGADGLLYPPTWLAVAHSDPADGLWMLAYLSFLLAGLLTYGLLRELRLGTVAALFGALVFAYSGTLTANAHFAMRLASLVWLPGLLWASLRMAGQDGAARVPGAICLALAMALNWLAGFPPYSAPVTLIAAAFCLYLVLCHRRQRGNRPALALALHLLAASILGLGIAAVHLLPVLEFFPVSVRTGHPDLAHISPTAFDPMGLLGYLLPDAFGHPSLAAVLPYARSPLALYLYSGENWETGEAILSNYNFTEYTVFVGTPTLFLAVIGACTSRDRLRFFFLGALIGLFGLAIAPWPLRYLYLLPGLETVPPMRFVGPACLFAAALGAMGVDRLADLSHRLHRALLIAALTTAGLCTLGALLCSGQDPPIYERLDVVGEIAAKYEPVNPGLIDRDYVRDVYLRGPGDLDYLEEGRLQLRANLWRCAAAMALAALWIGILPLARRRRLLHILTLIAVLATASELAVFGARLNRGMPLPYSHETEVHTFLRQQRDRERDSGGFMVARAHTVPVEPTMLPPGTLGPERIRDLHAYTFVDGRSAEPLKALYQPTWPDFMLGYVPRTLPDTEQLQRPLFDLLGVRYLLSTVPLVHGGNRVGPEVQGPGGEFFIYERPTALPRAFMVANLRILPDDEAVIEALIAPDLDPKRAALLTPDQAELLGPWRPDDSGGERQIRFLIDRAGEVELQIGPGPSGYLVLADTSLPGWSVEVDGTPAPLARGDLFLRVVPIQVEGECRVRFTYTTPGLPGGLTITVISVGVLLGLALYLAVSRRSWPMVEKPS